MEDFSSKYSGEQVEELLEKAEVYITDFTVNALIYGLNDEEEIPADLTALEEALSAHKVVLVPYDAADYTVGYALLTGYAEDLLYCRIITGDGLVFRFEANRGDNFIRYQLIEYGELVTSKYLDAIGFARGHITDFTVEDLREIAELGGSIQADTARLGDALASYKVVLVPDNGSGYAQLCGYKSGDKLYFSVSRYGGEVFDVETSLAGNEISQGEVTLRQ